MSGYENVVGGKLKLKGKALDAKSGGVKKKKKKFKHLESQISESNTAEGGSAGLQTNPDEDINEAEDEKFGDEGYKPNIDDQLTPAERRYIEQREKIDLHKMAKTANKSHRDRIEEFNQYLANMSEHYDIPKVGPG